MAGAGNNRLDRGFEDLKQPGGRTIAMTNGVRKFQKDPTNSRNN